VAVREPVRATDTRRSIACGRMPPLRVSILLHERDVRAHRVAYIVWHLARVWRDRGVGGRDVSVSVEHGPAGRADADVVVNHVDLTVVPAPYLAYLGRFPVAVNGRCTDISKRRVSGAPLRPGEPWDGPVIVKPDANCGGIGEERLQRETPLCRLFRASRLACASLGGSRRRERERWRSLRRLPSEEYPVFGSLADVPAEVLENPALVVERFVPEREGDLYAIRTYTHFAGRAISRRVLSTEPVVKAGGVVRRDEVEPPAEVVDAARRFGLDFGKVDYVVHDGRATVLDVNRTPTFGARLDDAGRLATADVLSAGLEALLVQGSSSRPP
jgi:hypothetical protein